MRKPTTFDGWKRALENMAATYRKALWADRDEQVEIWVEKSALAGVIYPVTHDYDVPLMPTGGYSSETFAWSAVEHADPEKALVIYSLYDFDRSGRDAANSLEEKLKRFAAPRGISVQFNRLALTLEMVTALDLPTRPHKHKTAADKKWPHKFACELDAIPPDDMRLLVRQAIECHLPQHELSTLKGIEQAERDTLSMFIRAD